MLRRDFMKLFGILAGGAATGIPHRSLGEVPLPEVKPQRPGIDVPIDVDIAYTYEKGATFRLDFADESLTIACADGRLDWTESSEVEVLCDRGQLEAFRLSPQPIDFYMTAALSWVSDESMIQKIHNADSFDLTYITAEGEYTIPNCRWESMNYDLALGHLELSGRAFPMED